MKKAELKRMGDRRAANVLGMLFRKAKPNGHARHYGNTLVKAVDLSAMRQDVAERVRKERGGVISRNSECICGSGRRFKRCCGTP